MRKFIIFLLAMLLCAVSAAAYDRTKDSIAVKFAHSEQVAKSAGVAMLKQLGTCPMDVEFKCTYDGDGIITLLQTYKDRVTISDTDEVRLSLLRQYGNKSDLRYLFASGYEFHNVFADPSGVLATVKITSADFDFKDANSAFQPLAAEFEQVEKHNFAHLIGDDKIFNDIKGQYIGSRIIELNYTSKFPFERIDNDPKDILNFIRAEIFQVFADSPGADDLILKCDFIFRLSFTDGNGRTVADYITADSPEYKKI